MKQRNKSGHLRKTHPSGDRRKAHAWEREAKRCPQCDCRFIGIKLSKYCTERCKFAAGNQKQSLSRIKSRPPRACKACGCLFSVIDNAWRNTAYCSIDCRRGATAKIGRETDARRRQDPVKKLAQSVRTRLWKLLHAKGRREYERSEALVGCDFAELARHLERQFVAGMDWSNHGSEWHVDHIVPLASAKTTDEVLALCHFTNLRPLLASENLRKSAKRLFLI